MVQPMTSRSTPSTMGQHWRLLLGIALIISASSVTMVLAAGGGTTEALAVGIVGLALGGGVAAYLYHLLSQLRRQ